MQTQNSDIKKYEVYLSVSGDDTLSEDVCKHVVLMLMGMDRCNLPRLSEKDFKHEEARP